MNVHINKINGKKVGYKVRWVEDGNPKESFRKHHKDALALQADIREKFVGDSTESFRKTYLTQDQIKDAEAATLELDGRLSLREAARIALKHWVDASSAVSIEEAYWKFAESLESSGLRKDTISKYKQTATKLLGCHPETRTTDLNELRVSSFLNQFQHPADFNGRRRELNRFLNFMVDSGWLPANPIKRIKAKRLDPKEPEVISPEQVEELFQRAKEILPAGGVPYLALSVFAAIRPKEMERLAAQGQKKNSINLNTGFITLSADISKGRRLRKIPIRPALEAFLKAFPEPLELKDYHFRKLKRSLSFTIPHDGLRHTGTTGIYLIHRNFGDTALETGNSERIIRDHYLGFWTDEESEKFWSIRP
jgi:hypothetical protein